MELQDCAFPLLSSIDITDDAKTAFDGVKRGAAGRRPPAHQGHGAGRPARGPTAGIFQSRRARRSTPALPTTCAVLVGRQTRPTPTALIAPVARPGRPRRALHGDDPAGPQPGDSPSSPASWGVPVHRDQQAHDSGATTPATQYPDLFPRRGSAVGNAVEAVDDLDWLRDRHLHPEPWPSAARRSSRRAVPSLGRPRPRTPRWTTSTTGSTGTPEGGLDLDGHPVGRLLRGAGGPDSRRSPVVCRRRPLRDRAGALEIDEFSRQRIDASVAELAEEARRGPRARSALRPALSEGHRPAAD